MEQKRCFLLRVFLGSCACTSIFSKFTLRKSKKRKAPETKLSLLRCVPHPPRTSGPRQLPCRLRGRRRRGHQGLRDGINLRWSEFIQTIFFRVTPQFLCLSAFFLFCYLHSKSLVLGTPPTVSISQTQVGLRFNQYARFLNLKYWIKLEL